jgi:nucleotide-binding universal stress UspA family protein
MAYHKILVALDENDTSTALFEEALDLASTLSAEMSLLCCFEQGTVAEMEGRVATFSEMDMSASEVIHDQKQRIELEHVRAWLESLAGLAAKRGVVAHIDAEGGPPAQRICELARDWGADLIVLGHSKRHHLRELFLGSINEQVIRDAPCAVLITKRQ